jgi:MHS family proline/betaine transporter-like MFS transporter
MDSERHRTRSVTAAVIANVIEWYDFAIYIFLAGVIARKFFPSGDGATPLVATLLTLGPSLLARPIGAMLFGRLADKIGRKAMLPATLFLMAGATFLIGFMPTYGAIGVTATVLLVISRILQGLSAGGEWGIATAYIVEWASARRRGLFGSLHQMSVAVGLALAVGVVALLNTVLTPIDIVDWAWRFPFVIGGLLAGLAGLYLRHTIEESPAYLAAPKAAPPPGNVILAAARVFGLAVVWTSAYYVLLNHMPVWTQKHGDLMPREVLWAAAGFMLFLACLVPLAGHLSDRLGRKPVLLAGSIALIVLPYPILAYFDSGDIPFGHVTLLIGLLVVALAIYAGAAPATMVELFAARNRIAWMASAYALAVAFFSGVGPYLSAWLIDRFQAASAHGLYLTVAAVISTLVVLTLRETASDDLA